MIIVATLGFCPARILEKSLEVFYRTRSDALDIRHVYLDQHYPLDQEQNRRDIDLILAKFGIQKFDAGRNLGLHDGFNYLTECAGMTENDIVIAYDADSMPTTEGWDLALVAALTNEKTVWASLMNGTSERELKERGYTTAITQFVETWATKTAVVNSICAFKGSWLLKVGGLREPCAFYGHLEAAMFDLVQRTGKQWVFLPAYKESNELNHLHDEEYKKYKWAHAHTQTWKGDFASYLLAGCP